LTSENKCFRLNFTFDGNLILYRFDTGHILWATEIVDPRKNQGYVDFSGNFVIYSKNNVLPFWESGTFGNPGAFVVLQNDGNLVVESPYGDILWTSNTESVCSGE
jgi:hypothetical protein